MQSASAAADEAPPVQVRNALSGVVVFDGPRPPSLQLLAKALAPLVEAQHWLGVRILCGDHILQKEDFSDCPSGEPLTVIVHQTLQLVPEVLACINAQHPQVTFQPEFEPVWDCPHAMLELVRAHPQLVMQATERLSDDRCFILAAVQHHPQVLQYYPTASRDRELVKASISVFGSDALRFAANELLADRGFVLELVPKTAILQYAARELLADASFMLDCVRLVPRSARHAASGLFCDPAFMLAALDVDLVAFVNCRVPATNREFWLSAVTINGLAIRYAPPASKRDPEIVRAAAKQNCMALFAVRLHESSLPRLAGLIPPPYPRAADGYVDVSRIPDMFRDAHFIGGEVPLTFCAYIFANGQDLAEVLIRVSGLPSIRFERLEDYVSVNLNSEVFCVQPAPNPGRIQYCEIERKAPADAGAKSAIWVHPALAVGYAQWVSGRVRCRLYAEMAAWLSAPDDYTPQCSSTAHSPMPFWRPQAEFLVVQAEATQIRV